MRLYTIGYGDSTPGLLIERLNELDVQLLLDVRTRASCRWQPEFRGDALKALVEEHGIEYQHWPTLGGEQPRWTPDEVARCARAIKQGRPIHTVCLLCAERDPNTCHRELLSSCLASELGWSVVHVFPYRAPRKARKSKHEAQLTLF